MQENTIFNPGSTPISTQPVSQPGGPIQGGQSGEPAQQTQQPIQAQVPVSPVSAPQPVAGVGAPAVFTPAPQQTSPPLPPPGLPLSHNSSSFDTSSSSKFSLALKALIGLVLVIGVGFLLYQFVFPLFGKKSEEKVTLSYWGLWENENVMQTVINDFQKDNSNIKVTYTKHDIKQYRNRLATRVANGTGPDIFRFHNTWTVQLKDVLAPVPGDTFQAKEFQQIFYPVAQKDLIKNGAIYGIPLEIDTLSLFVNTEILNNAGLSVPQTWDEFITVARKLTVKDETGKIKTSGASIGTYDNVTHASDIVSLLMVQNGSDIMHMTETAQNTSDALSFYTSFAKGEASVWDETLSPSLLAFTKGEVGMYFGYSWDVLAIKAANADLQFGIHPVPHLPARKMTIASYWVEGVSLKSKHQKESLLFLKYLARKETQQKLFTEASKTRLFGEPYSRVDLAPLLKDTPLLATFIEQAPDAVSSPFASDTYDEGLNEQLNAYLADAVRATLSNVSSQTAAETLAKGVAQILQQYGQL